MRIRVIAGVFALFLVCNVDAQWVTDGSGNVSTNGNVTMNASATANGNVVMTRAGVGGPIHSTARLRLTDTPGQVAAGPYHLTFGPAGAMYWGFRLDTTFNLHLDRQGNSGWAEGFVFDRDGNFGIGTVDPTEIVHAARDHGAGTIMRISNASNAAGAYTALRFTEGDTVKAEVKSTSSGTVPAADAHSLRITNYANGPMTFGTNNAERMRIFADGKVAIGSTTWSPGRLTVAGNAPGGYGIYTQQRSAVNASGIQNDNALVAEVIHDIPANVTNDGGLLAAQLVSWNMGPGTLNFATGGAFYAGNFPQKTGTINKAFAVQTKVLKGAGTIVDGYGLYIHDIEANNDYGIYQTAANDTNYFAGNVIVGVATTPPTLVLQVNGSANFDGTVTGSNIKAHYQDVAEWVPSTTDLAPGTVVILNRERNNEVMASAGAYDTTVAGVVSAQPGLSLGIEGEGKEQIATTGRVKVRVDARNGAIAIGDLLVTSDTPGTAMRSEPMSINGRKFHQPGTIVGKALEPLEGGVGEILVLLSLQ